MLKNVDISGDQSVRTVCYPYSVPENRYQSVIPGGADPPGLHGRDVADLGLATPRGDGKLYLL